MNTQTHCQESFNKKKKHASNTDEQHNFLDYQTKLSVRLSNITVDKTLLFFVEMKRKMQDNCYMQHQKDTMTRI